MTREVQSIFEGMGAEFLVAPDELAKKFEKIKAFVFDWDGVFNDGVKQANGSSSFNEIDSMGVNLLRYTYYRKHKRLPFAGIISGEKNETAFFFAKRECFHGSYSKFKDKKIAVQHFCEAYGISPEEICFFFDDVLDLSVALNAGIRIFVSRKASLQFTHYVKQHRLADYITASESGNFAVREACEMLMTVTGMFEEVLASRVKYDDLYKEYIASRGQVATRFYTLSNDQVSQAE